MVVYRNEDKKIIQHFKQLSWWFISILVSKMARLFNDKVYTSSAWMNGKKKARLNRMDKLSALKFIYTIITDKRNMNRYCMTQIRDMNTNEITATYNDAVNLVEDMIKSELELEVPESCRECPCSWRVKENVMVCGVIMHYCPEEGRHKYCPLKLVEGKEVEL